MELMSLQFIGFVAVLLCAYYAVGHFGRRFQWVVLLAASLAFYCLCGGAKLIGYLLATALVVWLFSGGLEYIEGQAVAARKEAANRSERKKVKAKYVVIKRSAFVVSLCVSFSFLFVLKYLNIIEFHLGIASSPTSLGLVLPLGISFYTFQAVSYLIDVYNGRCVRERNFLHFLLFVSYFPQMIQGPINRYDDLAPQLMEGHSPNGLGMRKGLLRLGYGCVQKFVIADILAINVKTLLGNITPSTPGCTILLGVLTYSIQMYADFSGGIDMVEGVSELLGVTMAQNFKQPYCAISLADFWRRWHMTLGKFMMDYVFYPIALTKPMQHLGKWCTKHVGKYAGRTVPACLANIIVFLFVGIWHGAEWHYVAWGLYNGVIVALSVMLEPLAHHLNRILHIRESSGLHRGIGIVRTFAIVNAGRYFDCITDVSTSLLALRNTFLYFAPGSIMQTIDNSGIQHPQLLGFMPLVIIACALVIVVDVYKERGCDVRGAVIAWHPLARMALYAGCGAMVMASFAFVPEGGGTFLYANF